MEPFSQADTGFARKHDGTGLGLPLARALVEHHGGSLTLDSRIGEGTTARVDLPAARVLAPTAAAAEARTYAARA